MRTNLETHSRLGIILALAGLLAISAGAYVAWRSAPVEPATHDEFAFDAAAFAEVPLPAPEPGAPTAVPMVLVYISGAVAHPDVYALPADARVKDLVLAAGGLTAAADPVSLNLAAGLSDAQHVHVPVQGETTGAAVPPAAGVGVAGLVDLNRAGVAELAGLPGIGEAIATRIIDYRESNGPFATIEDLQNVKGIGPALYGQIQSSITVGP
jgi:competence protein ComEA